MCYAIEPFSRRKMRATFNYSINYVTARSRLFLLRTRARSARHAGSANSPIPFAPSHGRPLLLSRFLSIVLPSRPARTPSCTFLRSVARKRKENTGGIPPGWMESTFERTSSLREALLRINRIPAFARTSKRRIPTALLFSSTPTHPLLIELP